MNVFHHSCNGIWYKTHRKQQSVGIKFQGKESVVTNSKSNYGNPGGKAAATVLKRIFKLAISEYHNTRIVIGVVVWISSKHFMWRIREHNLNESKLLCKFSKLQKCFLILKFETKVVLLIPSNLQSLNCITVIEHMMETILLKFLLSNN